MAIRFDERSFTDIGIIGIPDNCSFCNKRMPADEATHEPGSDDWACADCREKFDAEDAAVSARAQQIFTVDRLVIWMLN